MLWLSVHASVGARREEVGVGVGVGVLEFHIGFGWVTDGWYAYMDLYGLDNPPL